jgi:hypothetical protein
LSFSAALTVARPAAANSPDGTTLPAGSGGTLVTNAGTWTFGPAAAGGNLILLNGSSAAANNGSAVELAVDDGGSLYAFNREGHWYQWTGTTWVPLSSGPLPLSANGSTLVPGGTGTLVTGAGAWTFGGATGPGGNLILLNGSNSAADNGSAVKLAVSGSSLYALNGEGRWYEWTGFAWAAASASPITSPTNPTNPTGSSLTLTCASAVVVGLQWPATASATSYVVSRNGKTLGSSALLAFTDQSVRASSAYTYSVQALSGATHLSTQTLNVNTPAASPNGDAAYCPSGVIAGMTWNWSTGLNQQNGSDLWPATWGADGKTYFFWGDGAGFFGGTAHGAVHTSFGIGEFAASAPAPGSTPAIGPSEAINAYGGTNPVVPSTINGKANGIIAVGSDFYALGAIYEPGDGGGPSSEPNHFEIVYSRGNAYSWIDNGTNWQFCSDTTNPDGFCPISFVNFGPGNAGAMDNYVYLLGQTEINFIGNGGTCGCTYLARVPNDQLLTKSAYQVYTGVDASGNPQWSSNWNAMQPMFVDNGPRGLPIGKVVYNAALKRFIGVGQGMVNQAAFYDAPNPWGPWTSIGYYNSNHDGTGGWGNLGSTSFRSGWGDALGLNFMNAWTSADGLTMWASFSSDGTAGSSAYLAPLRGQSMDSFSLVSVTLTRAR